MISVSYSILVFVDWVHLHAGCVYMYHKIAYFFVDMLTGDKTC